jgi:hypothetical protein
MSRFSTLAAALAAATLVTRERAEERGREIAQKDALDAREARRLAWERGEQRRKVEAARARERRDQAREEQARSDRERFEAARGAALAADEIVKVEGVWTWRTGRHAGKAVSAKALAKRGIHAPGR